MSSRGLLEALRHVRLKRAFERSLCAALPAVAARYSPLPGPLHFARYFSLMKKKWLHVPLNSGALRRIQHRSAGNEP